MTVCSRAVVIALLIGFGAPIFAEADEIDAYISAQMRQLYIPGVSLAVVRNGRITKASLDDTITKYLPEAPQASRGITMRHLLTHTSGIRVQEF